MKLFQNLFNKNHDLNEEEQHKFNSMVGEDAKYDNSISLRDSITQLSSLEEINKIRNLLDTREKELESGNDFLVESEIKHSETPEFEEIGGTPQKEYTEEYVEEPITENDLNSQTYQDSSSSTEYTDSLNQFEEKTLSKDSNDLAFGETEDSVKEDTEYDDLDREEQSQPMPDEMLIKEESSTDGIELDIETESSDADFLDIDSISNSESDMPAEAELYLENIKAVFGEENIMSQIEDKNSTTYNPNKKLLHIGVRQHSSFGHGDALQENAWFIGQVKQLEDLKSYKMLRSEQGMKDLVVEKEHVVVIISFRATSFLNSINEFDFTL
jgi:hypothetical protein